MLYIIVGFTTNKQISLLCCQSLYFIYHLGLKFKGFDLEKTYKKLYSGMEVQ